MQKLLQYQSDYPPGITGDAYSVYRQQACATGSVADGFAGLTPNKIWTDWLDSLNLWIKNASFLDLSLLQNSPMYMLYASNAQELALLRSSPKDYIIFDAADVQEFAIFVNSWHAKAISEVKLTWVDQIVTQKTMIKERQVPVSVPYQVEKKRTVTKEKQVPFWELQ